MCQGVKLKLEGYVDVQNIGNGEFIVLVPFTKKNSNQTKKSDQSNTPLNVPKDKSILKLADLAWSDMMQDLSCLSHTSCSGASSDSNIAGVASSSSFDSKRKRGIYSDDVILDILRCSKSTTHLDEQNCERFGKVLELVNCLRDPHSGSCMLSRISNRMALQANSGSSCFCPEWLKVMLKTFTFLNIISTFIQLQQERTTLELLEKAVAQLGCFGIKLVTKDLEHLSVLCPKVADSILHNVCLKFMISISHQALIGGRYLIFVLLVNGTISVLKSVTCCLMVSQAMKFSLLYLTMFVSIIARNGT